MSPEPSFSLKGSLSDRRAIKPVLRCNWGMNSSSMEMFRQHEGLAQRDGWALWNRKLDKKTAGLNAKPAATLPFFYFKQGQFIHLESVGPRKHRGEASNKAGTAGPSFWGPSLSRDARYKRSWVHFTGQSPDTGTNTVLNDVSGASANPAMRKNACDCTYGLRKPNIWTIDIKLLLTSSRIILTAYREFRS